MNARIPCVVSIAGTDPSGGAGIQADIKAMSATGAYAASIITAVVAQNTIGVQGIHTLPPAFITQQIHSVFSDLDIRAVKIGMLHDEAVIEVVAEALKHYKPHCVVFDPVMVAKNGCALLRLDTIDFLKTHLMPHCTLITPNLFEAEKLLNTTINSRDTMEHAARTLSLELHLDVLVKGGHLDGVESSDVLFEQQHQTFTWFDNKRIKTDNTHGTGCTLSAAIASFLAQGYDLRKAIAAAKNYLTQALEAGCYLNVGHGCGPVDHFYFLENRHANATVVQPID